MSENEYLELFRIAFRYFLKHEWDEGQKGFAAKIGVSGATISEIKNGRANPSLDIAQKISSSFNLTLDDFFKKGREIKETGKPIEIHDNNNNIIRLPLEFRHPPIDKRLADMQENLHQIYKYGDDDLKSVIEMNLVSFRKTVDMERRISKIENQIAEKDKENLSLKEENETLKMKIINSSG